MVIVTIVERTHAVFLVWPSAIALLHDFAKSALLIVKTQPAGTVDPWSGTKDKTIKNKFPRAVWGQGAEGSGSLGQLLHKRELYVLVDPTSPDADTAQYHLCAIFKILFKKGGLVLADLLLILHHFMPLLIRPLLTTDIPHFPCL